MEKQSFGERNLNLPNIYHVSDDAAPYCSQCPQMLGMWLLCFKMYKTHRRFQRFSITKRILEYLIFYIGVFVMVIFYNIQAKFPY